MRLAAIASAACIFASGCGPREDPRDDITTMQVYVLMETTAGPIVLELDPVRAPVTTSNFLQHAREAHYDGTIFHRVVPGFVIQGGGWTPDLAERAKADAASGRPDATIRNEWQNGLRNERGTIGMARDADPDSATREFFINLRDNFRLDTPRETTGHAGYAVFGFVYAGWPVVEQIAAGATAAKAVPGVTDGSMDNVPLDPISILRVERITPAEARRRADEESPK